MKAAVVVATIAAVALAHPPAAGATAAPPADPRVPRLLVTGDSMIMFTDVLLRRTLTASGAARVTVDRHVGTGLTKPWLLRWEDHAALQTREFRPDVVLATMGANDLHPIGRSPCCGRAWVRTYAKRIGRLARIWRRGGARRVYWLTLPIQAHPRLEPLFTAVDRAVARAPGIRVIDVRPIVNPDGRYHDQLEVSPGVVRQIRYEDGVHLWWPGAELVANAVIARLEADGVLSGGAGRASRA